MNLRAVSVKTGEVMANVTTSKTVSSVGVDGGAFKFVTFDKLLEIEGGITTNEPGAMALRRTVEKAVLALVIEGAEAGVWGFADPAAAADLIREYRAETATEVASSAFDAQAFKTASAAATERARAVASNGAK